MSVSVCSSFPVVFLVVFSASAGQLSVTGRSRTTRALSALISTAKYTSA